MTPTTHYQSEATTKAATPSYNPRGGPALPKAVATPLSTPPVTASPSYPMKTWPNTQPSPKPSSISSTSKPRSSANSRSASPIRGGVSTAIRSIEDGLLSLGHFEDSGHFDAANPDIHATITAARQFRSHSQAVVNLSIYEQRIHRIQKEALSQLQELQAERLACREAELNQAVELHKMHGMEDLPYDLATDGFVYASTEIATECRRRDRLDAAEIASRYRYDSSHFRSGVEELGLEIDFLSLLEAFRPLPPPRLYASGGKCFVPQVRYNISPGCF